MQQTTTRRHSASDLAATITLHLEELLEATAHARLSETMLEYLEMCARFHSYSSRNIWLIMMNKPSATQVAGYHTWRSLDRHVRKGEKGIPIFAPIVRWLDKEEDETDEPEELLLGFKVVYVFDVSQTEGEPLPEAPTWKSPEQHQELTNNFLRYAQEQGIQVETQELPDSTQGASYGGRILLSPAAGTKTLIHELAHERLHQNGEVDMDSALMELEAEAVAYIVGRHFGLKELASPNYLALHGVNSEMIEQHTERIKTLSTEFIQAASSSETS